MDNGDGDTVGTCKRMTNTQILNDRYYLFTFKRNMRGYEWHEKHLLQFFRSIESAGAENVLELGTIVLTPIQPKHLAEAERAIDGFKRANHCRMYDVHDGRQRITSTIILLCVIRDVIEEAKDKIKDAYYDKIGEAARDAIAPKGSRRNIPRVRRIATWDIESPFLQKIQLCDTEEDTLTPKLGKAKRQEETLLNNAYNLFRSFLSLNELGQGDDEKDKALLDRLDNLWDNLMNNTSITILTLKDYKEATKFVQGQRFGKNPETVDCCKYSLLNHNMDKDSDDSRAVTEDGWKTLCDEIDRPVVEDACVMIGQIMMGKCINDDAEGEMLFTQFLDERIEDDGSSKIFNEIIGPAARMLLSFRKGDDSLYSHLPGECKTKLYPSLRFLYWASKNYYCKGKDMLEILVLAALTSHRKSPWQLEEEILGLERIALWMMIGQPKPIERQDMVRAMLQHLKKDGTFGSSLELTEKQKHEICQKIETDSFAGPVREQVAKSILERLNATKLMETQPSKGLSIDMINPDCAEWLHRLGNKVLVIKSEKKPAKIPQESRFAVSSFPMTKAVGTFLQNEEANLVGSCELNQANILEAARDHWKLMSSLNRAAKSADQGGLDAASSDTTNHLAETIDAGNGFTLRVRADGASIGEDLIFDGVTITGAGQQVSGEPYNEAQGVMRHPRRNEKAVYQARAEPNETTGQSGSKRPRDSSQETSVAASGEKATGSEQAGVGSHAASANRRAHPPPNVAPPWPVYHPGYDYRWYNQTLHRQAYHQDPGSQHLIPPSAQGQRPDAARAGSPSHYKQVDGSSAGAAAMASTVTADDDNSNGDE